jgi:tetratricopeptide (TPR) repeat protein
VAADAGRQVRTALAHGDAAGARVIAEAESADGPAGAVGRALVAMHFGRDAEARSLLTPVADRFPLSDAAVELGLLEVRTGRIAQGRARLDRIASLRTFNSPDDYFRLARAARGTREYQLANDAYQRTAKEPRADIQTSWGDLFLQWHQAGDALTSYQEALGYDPQWVPAMIGAFRALADSDPKASRAALEQATKIAPEHPDVLLATAEHQIESDDFAAAKTTLDTLAKVKPDSVEEAALRAAIGYKDNGTTGAEVAAARVATLHPQSPLGYRLASEQAARQYRFDDAAALATKAVAIDPQDPLSQFQLGLHLLRTGDEARARTALEISWELDRSSPVTKNLLTLLDHLDTFEVVPHNQFIFKFHKAEAAVLKAYALPLADEAYRVFAARYGIRPEGPILVEIFPEHDDFAVRTLGLPGLVGALGACFGRVVSMDSPRARPQGDFSWQATLWHELGHVFTLHASDFRVPRWLTEGASTYEEYKRNPAWGRELNLEFARELSAGRNFGVKNLPQAFKRPESLALAYFEASLLVEHLVEANGEAGLRTLLNAYAGGVDDTAAFAKAFAKSVDDVEASFKAFVDSRYGALAEAMKTPAREVKPDDLPGLRARAETDTGNFISQVSYALALIKDDDFAAAKAPLERAAKLAPMATGEASPRYLLAGIAETEKDPARARRELMALLDFDHTNITAARKLASFAADAKATDEEDRALRLVADLDPFDAGTHVKLGRRLMERGRLAEALIEFEASLALGPPNPAEAHTDRAEALLKLGRKDEARRAVLTALELAPTYGRAQDVLLSVMGR